MTPYKFSRCFCQKFFFFPPQKKRIWFRFLIFLLLVPFDDPLIFLSLSFPFPIDSVYSDFPISQIISFLSSFQLLSSSYPLKFSKSNDSVEAKKKKKKIHNDFLKAADSFLLLRNYFFYSLKVLSFVESSLNIEALLNDFGALAIQEIKVLTKNFSLNLS